MTAPTIQTNTQPIIGANGDIFTAPVGTAPLSMADWDSPPAPWQILGMVSDDGVSWTPPEEATSDIGIWQSLYPARVVTTGLSSSMAFALDGWDRVTIPFALGGGTFDETGDSVIFHPPKAGESVSKAIFVKVMDGDIRLGLYFPKGRVTGRDDTVFKKDEAALLNVTFSLEGSTAYEPYQLIFDPDTFPDVGGSAPASGATAGIPGVWTPPGSVAPSTLGGMTGITASPTTAWTTGQHVVLSGGGGNVFWDLDSWETGTAP